MRRAIFLSTFLLFLLTGRVLAGGATIVTHEEERYFYRADKMDKFEGQYEYTYFLDLDKNRLIRTRIYDFQNKKITPDETVYTIQSQLNSHPFNASRFGLLPLIRAFGQTNADTVEMLIIKGDIVHSISTSPESLIISRARRLK